MATGDKKIIQIIGRVMDRKTKQGLPNLRVEAWDKDLIVKTAIGSAATDQQGSFVIQVAKGQLNDLFGGRHALLFFKVFHEGQLLTSTEASVLWDRDAQDAEIVIKVTVDSPPPDNGNSFTLSGQVRHANGSTFKEGSVQAFIVVRGQEGMLGETKTDLNGQFEIAYTLSEAQVSQLANVRVLVRAFDSQRNQLAESPSFIPDTTVTINLTVPNPPPPPDETLSLRGRIRGKDGSPIAGAIVRAFITSSEKEIPVGEARTDSNGSYVITATVQSLETQPADARLEARAFDKRNTMLGASSSPLQARVSTMDVVAEFPPAGDEWCAVSGQVLQQDGKPLGSGVVRVYGAVPSEGALKKASATITAVDDARFRIEYQPGEFSPRFSDANRVAIRVFRVVNNKEQELVQSPSTPVQFRADAEQFLVIHLGDNGDDGDTTRTFVVHGRITRGGVALFNEFLNVSAFDGSSPLAKPVLSDGSGNYRITYKVGPTSDCDIASNPTSLKVTVADGTTSISAALMGTATGDDEINIDLPVKPGPSDSTVEGVVFMDYGLAAKNIAVRVYHRGFGDSEQVLGQTNTKTKGSFNIAYDSGGKVINLEVRVLDPAGKEVTISNIRFNASKHEVFKLIAPASVQPLVPSEYERLFADLDAQLPANVDLGDAREDASHKDLTMLRLATGWDARLIAVAALADKLSGETGIGREALYGIFRTGLPTNAQNLGSVSVPAVQDALNKANEAGIVSLSPSEITAAVAAFRSFAGQVRLLATAPGGLSNVGNLLDTSVLTGGQKQTFQDLYFANPNDGGKLWADASANGISDDAIRALQLQGKLAYLTFNNVELIKRLLLELKSSNDVTHLVDLDFDKAMTWQDRIKTLVNSQHPLSNLIPPAYTGDTTDQRLDAYTEDLARRVRLSFPTQIVTKMIGAGELPLGSTLGANVAAFLKDAAARGFELGRTPFDLFVNEHTGVAINGKVEATKQAVRQLQRLYQVTPSDESLKTVYESGFTSARDIAAYTFTDFIDRFGARFPSLDEAGLVYRKSQQVSAVTYNLLAAAGQIGSGSPMFVTSPSGQELTAAKSELIKRFPTMEALFGSLDFCECEHCRSVLSPAAYLVDLLHFLDPKDAPSPYDALAARRPDLPQLQLTCENTNTVLPYIDVVNEILEYYVHNGALDPGAVRDTGVAKSEELLAEPQYITDEAYNTLVGEKYPLGLPFDLWLETVRQFSDQFETPLWKLLEVFRPTDRLFRPVPGGPGDKSYYRSSIFAEYLGVSPSEYEIFTNPNSEGKWYELYGYTSSNQAVAALNNAKTLARRLGVTYKELIAILKTGFVNPNLANVATALRRIGVGIDAVFRYEGYANYTSFTQEERAAFETRLDDLSAAFETIEFDARDWLDKSWKAQAFDKIVVLSDPDTGCNFDQTVLHYADQNGVEDLVFIKLNLFVRLWRKLGWEIDEIDRALQTFLPADSPLEVNNIGEALKTALVYIAHLKYLDEQLKVGKNSRAKLLTFWSNLSISGENPLYTQLFLTRTVLKDDPVFDDPVGKYLSRDLQAKEHLLALQGALNLTESDVRQIFDHFDSSAIAFENAHLTLENVSLLYRYGLLAKALQLPVVDLIALKKLSGLDPFTPLNPKRLTGLNLAPGADAIDEDAPFTQTLRFVELAAKVRESGFKIEDLDYILRQRFDPVGKYRENPSEHLDFVRSLSTAMLRIDAEHSPPLDPATLTDEVLRQELALVLPADVAETFMAMWSGTIEYEAVQTGVSKDAQLDPEDFADEPTLRVSYDELLSEQRLVFKGVLLDAKKAVLAASSKKPSLFLVSLLNTLQEQARSYFANHFEKSSAGEFTVGFLDASDFELLFAPVATGEAGQEQQRQRRKRISETFLPFLQQRLIRQLVIQTLVASSNSNPALTEALLSDAKLLYDPSQTSRTPLLAAFIAAQDAGVSASFLNSTGTLLKAKRVSSTDTAEKPVGTDSASFGGVLEVPTSGPYRFFAQLDKTGAEAELRIDDRPAPLLDVTAQTDNAELSPDGSFIELKAGVAYGFSFEVRKLAGRGATLLVQGENLPKGSLARLRLYPAESVERVRRARVLLAKALQLIAVLGLDEREVRYLLTHAADFDIDLGKLPTRESDDSPTEAVALFRQLVRLLDYASLKREIAGGTNDLISIFEKASLGGSESEPLADLSERVAALTRRDKATAQKTAESLGMAPSGFGEEKGLLRLWNALQLVQQLGISPVTIAASTRIVVSSGDRSGIARDLRNTVKAQYEPETWQRIAQPVFDKLRRKKRDALAAYIMHKKNFERIEQLFEYFLIDPGMEPVVQTSRLRLAISSVQLFIQRCLLNLESEVSPNAINSEQWEWMKRYRVWEANRKIFLFPENWLEPEFRDDKTHLFKELEGSLLQGDVSNDLAEDALFTYLRKLEELARLEIVTIYNDTKPRDLDSSTLHVIGRTYGTPHKYFYRRYAHRAWTPWEPVPAEIEGDHVVAVVWRQRLHLFWLTFMEKADPNANDKLTPTHMADLPSSAIKPQHLVDVQLNWSEQFQGEWTPRQSAGFSPSLSLPFASSPAIASNGEAVVFILKGNPPAPPSTPPSGTWVATPPAIGRGAPTSFNAGEVFVHVSRETVSDEERRVNIHLGGPINWTFRFAKNSPQEADIFGAFSRTFTTASLQMPYMANGLQVTHLLVTGALEVLFTSRTVTAGGITETPLDHPREILQSSGTAFSLVRSSNLVEITADETRSLVSPFFLVDSENTFFVEPRLTETTIQTYDNWAPPPSPPDPTFANPTWWQNIPLGGLVPFVDPDFPFEPDPIRVFDFKLNQDWLGNPATILQYGESFVGASGSVNFQLFAQAGGTNSGLPIFGSVLILPSTISSALSLPSGGLSVIGNGGLNQALLTNLNNRPASSPVAILTKAPSTPAL